MKLNPEQIAALEELACILEHAESVAIRTRLGNRMVMGDRAKILILLVVRAQLKSAK